MLEQSIRAKHFIYQATIDHLAQVLPTLIDNTVQVKATNQTIVDKISTHVTSVYGWDNDVFFSPKSSITIDNKGLSVRFPRSAVFSESPSHDFVIAGVCQTQAQIITQLINASTVHDGQGVVEPVAVIAPSGETHVRPMISNHALLDSLPDGTDLSSYSRANIPLNSRRLGVNSPHLYDFTEDADDASRALLQFSLSEGMRLTYNQGLLTNGRFEGPILTLMIAETDHSPIYLAVGKEGSITGIFLITFDKNNKQQLVIIAHDRKDDSLQLLPITQGEEFSDECQLIGLAIIKKLLEE